MPPSENCHELATTSIPSGYNNQFTLGYNPALHSGATQVGLAPLATLTYVVPFTTPTHTNKCQPVQQVANNVSAAYVDAVGGTGTAVAPPVNQYIGMPPCVPGTLDIQKVILPPASATSIPPSGLISFDVTLTNTSATATLDIPHFVDLSNAGGVTLAVVGVTCTVLTNSAKCPTTPVVPGMMTPAVGSPVALANPFDIDHEWGFVGNNTFPPNSSLKFTITMQLSNPTRDFNCINDAASFAGENDPNGWTPASAFASSCPPPAPELSLQKKVSAQIVGPSTLVTYTVIITNIGPVDANNSVFTDALPPALLASNPGGYTNLTCTDLTAQPFVPNPKGIVVCPAMISTAAGLTATIATFGHNTSLQFTYQALMPAGTVSIDNLASVTAPTISGLSFGVGTAQSLENVQVAAAPLGQGVPALASWQLALLGLLLAASGAWFARGRG